MKVIKFKELSKKLGGRGRNAIKRDMEKRGFPKPMKIGRSTVWDEDAVDRWLQEQAEKPYLPEPVAVPAPGKRRGRRKKADTSAASPKVYCVKEENSKSDVVRFVRSIQKRIVIPPDEIIADGKFHYFYPDVSPYGSRVGWYLFEAEKPAVGLYGSLMSEKSWRWSRKTFDAMNGQEKSEYREKLKRMRKVRKESKSLRVDFKEKCNIFVLAGMEEEDMDN